MTTTRQSGKTTTARPSERELTLTRVYDAPAEKLFRAWTDPEQLKRWIAPRPYVTVHAEMAPRPGGVSMFVMKGPDGSEIPCPGVYLEVVENRRIVTTDAYTAAWEPSAKPFMTVILTFEEGAGRTRYTARCLHWSAEDCDSHEKMGFHQGWAQCADQLAEVAAGL